MKDNSTKEDWQKKKRETAILMIVPALVLAFSLITSTWNILTNIVVIVFLVQCGLYVYAWYQEVTHD